MKPKVIVICGPTASGKTSLSIELAKRINGEIISCDSMQIYKDMNIGTAKVTEEEMQGIQHYLIDFVSPDVRYSVANYKNDAEKAIETIIDKGKIPIIVGGTGLYLDSLIYGIEYPEIKFDEKYREKLENEIKKLFPQATTIRMDVDTVTKKNSHETILNKFKNDNIDILIGTQMVVKGHHFPNVNLVGVIAADGSLNIEDYRANERTFDLLTQVARKSRKRVK